MRGTLEKRLEAITIERLKGMRRGVEKESLRVLPDGSLAVTPHPSQFGSALTHPHITTDFSESQLELITGVHVDAEAALRELNLIHQVVYRVLDACGGERLWVSSMPCELPDDRNIPIGQYGSSNAGRAKSVYRIGLSHRYGRRMQTISGIHYNWSMPGVSSEDYFALIRNFRRHAFLLLYLFGASPALCSSFLGGRSHNMELLGDSSAFMPYGTSLRMGRLGYHSDAQASLAVSYASLDAYGASLQEALTRPWPAYDAIGIRGVDGEYNQLSTNLLQLENEFYSSIRPKRVTHAGERPLQALQRRGVEYVEIRLVDLDPFEPLGINAQTMRFMDVFLLHCLLSESPIDTSRENGEVSQNLSLTAARGREAGLCLLRRGRRVSLVEWGEEIVAQCGPIAEALDAAHGGGAKHLEAVASAAAALREPECLPSARVLEAIGARSRASFIDFMRERSEQVRNELLAQSLSVPEADEFDAMATASVQRQLLLESADRSPFESYRQALVGAARPGHAGDHRFDVTPA